MTSREKKALAAKGQDWRTVEAERLSATGMVQLDFTGRVMAVEGGQIRLVLTDLPADLALTYHTVAAMFLAQHGRVPRGKVQRHWEDLEAYLKETVNLALDGQVQVLNPDGSIGLLALPTD